ncbi:hypothetical protein RRG08_043926 [Elysia crispata]|uniref:Caveolin n=1 Tax=Elysia crispata TaxID=231223 RepID=A0AAE0XVF5_9GAST|nr:hypothetical protein RRG08_043926 [Elysia crispata]
MGCCDYPDPDLEDRDPHKTSSHIKVIFNDVIGEPKGNHSLECVWDSASCCYEFCFTLVYSVMTLCCGMCIALELGCEFGNIIFWHVWCCTPGIKSLFFQTYPCKCLYSHIVRCLADPWCEACSYCCGAFEEPDKDDTHFKTRLY